MTVSLFFCKNLKPFSEYLVLSQHEHFLFHIAPYAIFYGQKYHNLIFFVLFCVSTVVQNSTKTVAEEKKFRDCADLYLAGFHKNGVYNIQINSQENKKVRASNLCSWQSTADFNPFQGFHLASFKVEQNVFLVSL